MAQRGALFFPQPAYHRTDAPTPGREAPGFHALCRVHRSIEALSASRCTGGDPCRCQRCHVAMTMSSIGYARLFAIVEPIRWSILVL